MKVVYEDNHIIIVSKVSGEIVQGDKTGDTPLSETVKQYIKETYAKPGNVFLGVVHRLDRPVSGLVVFARTSKALPRLCKMFAEGQVHKTYWAITTPPPTATALREREAEQHDGWVHLEHWLSRNEKQNKSYAVRKETQGAKQARLRYRVLAQGDHYDLVEVELLTGRHHQIRCQLSTIGRTIKGDLKYGAKRSNPDGSISLLSHRVQFEHPVSHQIIDITSPLPEDHLWTALSSQ